MALARKPLSLKARALQALALREHSRSELRQKLLRGGWNARASGQGAGTGAESAPALAQAEAPDDSATPDRAAEIDALLDELQAAGLLSEARFVESRVHARASRFGNRRIQAELARHGLRVDPETAATLRSTEYERALAVWQRRYGEAAGQEAPHNPAEAARQMRFLAARGFSLEVIRRVVKGGPIED